MNSIQTLFTLVAFVGLLKMVKLLENGLARTPPMGWMSWGYYMCGVDCDNYPDRCLNEQLILSVVDWIYENGYQEAGYEYIIIDDCWMEHTRSRDGRLVPDRTRFPHGMKYIADYIHGRGLKFGMYTCIGNVTCAYFPGSWGHYGIDAMTFAEWDVDFIKVDGCYVEDNEVLDSAYPEMGRFLNKTERPMVYSCSWPYYVDFIHSTPPDFTAVAENCNMWRLYHDVKLSWNSIRNIVKFFERQYPEIAPHHGPGRWNDPDMLIFGTNVLKENQSRVQLVVYAMLSAPLLLSCNVKMITEYEKKLLQNLDLIAINQDPLGIMAEPFKAGQYTTIWVKRHHPKKADKYHSFSFALVNLMLKNDPFVTFTPRDFGLKSLDGYTVLDVLKGVYIRNITINNRLKVSVPAEDAILYTLYPL